jgi:hemerythrin-like domain-containing protein
MAASALPEFYNAVYQLTDYNRNFNDNCHHLILRN